MILFLGTSSLVRLYFEEEYSRALRDWVREAEIVATSRVGYTETISAVETRLARRDLSQVDYNEFMKAFTRDWESYLIIDFNDIEAGRLVKNYGLRRFDAIHLSSAKLLAGSDPNMLMFFSSADERLCRAAAGEGLKVLPLHVCAGLSSKGR